MASDIKKLEEIGNTDAANQLRETPEYKLLKHYQKINKNIIDIRNEISSIENNRDMNSQEKGDKTLALNRLMTQVAHDALRFDPKYDEEAYKRTPLPNQGDYDTKRKEAASKSYDDYARISQEYNDQLEAWLRDIGLDEEQKKKIRDDNLYRISDRSYKALLRR